MANIVYQVQLIASCTKNSTCPNAIREVVNQSSPEAIHEQVKFMKTHVFCNNCGAPNRFIANFLPKKV